uniref:Uncharacterized protein n=1 Tax=Ralstonia solanacearum TaxID=305 RepID=A0A0S4TWM4_RALSL|nr:protein of unknown function [Ralstonia solanacearum]
MGQLLLERYKKTRDPDEPECVDAASFSASDAWPSSVGMTFKTVFPYALKGCEETITLPYPALLQFLSTEGRANIQVFQKAPHSIVTDGRSSASYRYTGRLRTSFPRNMPT